MIVEGKGPTIPSRVAVELASPDLRILKERARRQAQERGYRGRADQWGQGLITRSRAGLQEHEVPIFVGLAGEFAVCKYLNVRMGHTVASLDLTPKKRGDGSCDLVIKGLSAQIKAKQKPFRENLVRVRDEFERTLEHLANIHVFTFYPTDSDSTVYLLGWMWTKDMARYPIAPARRGVHTNVEVPDEALLPMSRLVREIKAREELSRWL